MNTGFKHNTTLSTKNNSLVFFHLTIVNLLLKHQVQMLLTKRSNLRIVYIAYTVIELTDTIG